MPRFAPSAQRHSAAAFLLPTVTSLIFLGLPNVGVASIQTRSAQVSNEPLAPANLSVLGSETYLTMNLRQLSSPMIAFINKPLALQNGYQLTSRSRAADPLAYKNSNGETLNDVYGYAGKLKSEAERFYTTNYQTVFVGGYGGIGMEGNEGDGRSTIHGRFRTKGGGRTMKVMATEDHGDGAASFGEGLRETLAGNLLSYELPYGANQTLALITTGTIVRENEERTLIVAEDPVRIAHYFTNDHAQERGGEAAAADTLRVRVAMSKINEALPKPKGFSPVGLTKQAVFKIGLKETIDRLAIQQGYAWAHKIYHGATSPSNASLDGRMIDFGTLSIFKGFQRIQILSDDAPNGDSKIFVTDILNGFQEMLAKHLPDDLKAALPTREEFENEFKSKFENTRRLELVRMGGVIDEFATELSRSVDTRLLGKILFDIAMRGNENVIPTYGQKPMEEMEFPNGEFDLGKILAALSSVNIRSIDALNAAVLPHLADAGLRGKLIAVYQKVFLRQIDLAKTSGFSEAAEANYRRLATEIRNRPMDLMIKSVANRAALHEIERLHRADPNTKAVQQYLDQRVSESRRDFRDGPRFTLTLGEKMKSDGTRVRDVFDLQTNLRAPHIFNSRVKADSSPAARQPMTCEAIF